MANNIDSDSLHTFLVIFTETLKVLASTLAPPRLDYTLRKLSEDFVKSLEQEMVLRPLNFGKPLIAVVRGISQPSDSKEEELDTYVLEVIGGNHRREAIKNLNSVNSQEHHKFVDVELFCG